MHTALVAKGAKITPIAVRAWALTERSIPAKYWAAIKDIADEKGIPVSFEELADSVRAA